MFGTKDLGWLATAGAVALSIALVTAFSVGDTGTRAVSASVVNDADAFLGMEANGNNAYQNFVSTNADGTIEIAFDGNNADASGTGINPNSSYEFNSLVNVTNQATEDLTIDVTIGGTDSTLCEGALTSTASQSSSDYASDPAALSVTKGSTAYLGIKVMADGKTSGDTVSCTLTVSA